MLKRIAEWLALTKTERTVILFLVGTFLAGAGIRLYQETFPERPQFDYRASDSTFAALSAAAINQEGRSSDSEFRVNLNTASKAELMKLPGIGEIIAGRILSYREDSGPFTSVEQLRKVKGISKKKFEKLKLLITIED